MSRALASLLAAVAAGALRRTRRIRARVRALLSLLRHGLRHRLREGMPLRRGGAPAAGGIRSPSPDPERACQELLAVVSHDLRGPLTNILMASKVLDREVARLSPGPEGEAARSSSRLVGRCAELMARLVDDLQDRASIEAGQLALVRAPHPAASIVLDTVEAFGPVAEGKGIRLSAHLADGELAASCDRDRITQVLTNLVSNAIHASPRGGVVTVSVAHDDGGALFSVADAGAGIPRDELPRIFDRYRRGRSARYRGTGLGLAIARDLVELHGGRIWAESDPGRGTTFRFRLPSVGLGAPSDVLVVDDDADIRFALRTVLEMEGYHVALAGNGREALEMLRAAPPPALIFLDLMMPVMNGAEFLGLVRTDERLRSVPVVLVSAFSSLAKSVLAESQGALGKPFDVADILGLASRYCSPRQRPQPN